jgi:hypothetical protein
VSYVLNFASNDPEWITRMLNTVDVEGDTVIICFSFSYFFWGFLVLLKILIGRAVISASSSCCTWRTYGCGKNFASSRGFSKKD